MAKFGLAIAAFHGLALVGVLFIIEVIVGAFVPGWHLPFSHWWGLIGCIPGIGWSIFANNIERKSRW